MTHPLVLNNVWKTFGKVGAVRGLSLAVPSGSVYGFLGPNGAGKSTSIRMILGLQKPDRGSIALFRQSLAKQGIELLRRIGSLVESPSLYLHLTGRENLEIHRILLALPIPAVEAALETVDLLAASDRLVRGYSSGMKQRLGLAIALLGNPELLLLDEPTNGLDPAGIHEVRNLIRDLPNRRGVTVFLSSHLLAEVEQSATHVAIISQGELRFAGTSEELRSRRQPSIAVEVDRPDEAARLLEQKGLEVSRDGNRLRTRIGALMGPGQINRMLVESGIEVTQLGTEYPTLEETFLELTAASAGEEVP